MQGLLQHLSISSIGTYMRCGYQWYFRYAEGIKIPPSIALIKGKSFHKAEEENFSQKVSSKTDLPIEEVKEIFSANYDANLEEAEVKEGENPGEEKDRSISALEKFHVDAASKIQPTSVEEDNQIEVAGISFVSRVDLVDEGEIIRDLKLSGRSPSGDAALTSIQLTGYDLTYRKVHGRPPKGLALNYAVTTKTPKTIALECLPRRGPVLEAFEERVGIVLDSIQKGVFHPAQEDSWVCSERYCGYWGICKFGARARART